MKKIIFCLITVAMLFSCSDSNHDDFMLKREEFKKYPVSFVVKNKLLDIEVTPMKSNVIVPTKLKGTDLNVYYGKVFLQYIVYKETGEFLSTKIAGGDSWDQIVKNGDAKIEDQLEAGKYHISIVSTYCDIPEDPSKGYIQPKNYFTDHFTPRMRLIPNFTETPSFPDTLNFRKAGSVYYDTFELTVGKDAMEPIDVVLEPMWNTVSLKMTNQKRLSIPEKTTHISVLTNPFRFEFSLQSKFSKDFIMDPTWARIVGATYELIKFMPLADFLAADEIKGSVVSSAGDKPVDLEIRYLYLKDHNNGLYNYDVLKIDKLGSFDMKENNKNYNITVDIKSAGLNPGDAVFNVSIKDYVGENVDVELK